MSGSLAALNERYGFLDGEGVYDSETGRTYKRRFFATEQLADRYRIEKNGKLYLGNEWYEWKGRRVLKGRVYRPGGATPFLTDERANEYINLWEDTRPPLPATPAEEKRAVGNVEKLFIEGLCKWLGINGVDRDKLLGCLLWPIAHPGERTFWSPLLWSRQGGTGKSLLVEIVASAHDVVAYTWGPKKTEAASFDVPPRRNTNAVELDADNFLGTFNAIAGARTLIVCSETYLPEKRAEFYNLLKRWHTSGRIVVNQKNVPMYESDNCASLVFLSNHSNALPLKQGDRRYWVKHVTERELDLRAKGWPAALNKWHNIDRRSGSDLRFYAERVYRFPNFEVGEKATVTPDMLKMIGSNGSVADAVIARVADEPDLLLDAWLTAADKTKYGVPKSSSSATWLPSSTRTSPRANG